MIFLTTPLLLQGQAENEAWGGRRLCDNFGIVCEDTAQTISAINLFSENVKIKSGEYAGLTLLEAARLTAKTARGKKAGLPFSVRLVSKRQSTPAVISQGDRLIYIAECDEDCKLLLGFKRTVKPAAIEAAVEKGTLSDMLEAVRLSAGEARFIPAGTPHSLRENCVAVVISAEGAQLTQDSPEFAKSARLSPLKEKSLDDETMLFPFGTVKQLLKSKRFTCELLRLNGNAGLCEKDSFSLLTVTDGSAVISYPSGNLSLSRGDCMLLPAGIRIIISGRADILNLHL